MNHWIPSAFIARFSNETDGRSRRRPVYTCTGGGGSTPVRSTAGGTATERNRYFLDLDPQFSRVDDAWAYYETNLSRCLDELIARPKDGETSTITTLDWLTVLVPFTAALLVRSPDFDHRYTQRFEVPTGPGIYSLTLTAEEARNYFEMTADDRGKWTPAPSTPATASDNLNLARLIEMQRLLLPITISNWVVIHTPTDADRFVLPDTGYVPGGPRRSVPDSVLTVPVGPHTAVAIGFAWWNTLTSGSEGAWHTTIRHVDLAASFVREMNEAAARTCQRMLIAGTPESLSPLAKILAEGPAHASTQECLWLHRIDRTALWATELEWFKLVSVVARYRPGDSRVKDFDLDVASFARYVGGLTHTVDRRTFDHIALGTDEDANSIIGCMPMRVDLDHPAAVQVTYADGSPNDTIRGVHTTPEAAAAGGNQTNVRPDCRNARREGLANRPGSVVGTTYSPHEAPR